jgi:hypothetical protein
LIYHSVSRNILFYRILRLIARFTSSVIPKPKISIIVSLFLYIFITIIYFTYKLGFCFSTSLSNWLFINFIIIYLVIPKTIISRVYSLFSVSSLNTFLISILPYYFALAFLVINIIIIFSLRNTLTSYIIFLFILWLISYTKIVFILVNIVLSLTTNSISCSL